MTPGSSSGKSGCFDDSTAMASGVSSGAASGVVLWSDIRSFVASQCPVLGQHRKVSKVFLAAIVANELSLNVGPQA